MSFFDLKTYSQISPTSGQQKGPFGVGRRSRSTPYLNPYSINQHFIRMGYKGVQTAHGLRRTALTAGQDVLGFSAELIQRQLSHAIGDKVRQSYDDSTLLDERRKFMIAWCDALLAQGMKV